MKNPARLESICPGCDAIYGEEHDGTWVQRAVFKFALALSAHKIDPGLGPLVSICPKLPAGPQRTTTYTPIAPTLRMVSQSTCAHSRSP